MSTDHIKRCISGNFAKPNSLARMNMERELRLRDEEAYWRALPMPGEENIDGLPEDDKDEGFVGLIYGTPIYVDPNIHDDKRKLIKMFLNGRGM
jgi:hypothetical protein